MKKRISFRVSDELDKRIIETAEMLGLNPSAWLRKIVDENAVLVDITNTTEEKNRVGVDLALTD